MKRIIIFILLVLIVLPSMACSMFRKRVPEVVSDEQLLRFDGRILDAERLMRESGLLIVPFKAGAGVAATNDLDKLALFMAKAISDGFKNKDSNLRILTASESQDADLILKGYIVGVDDPKGFISKLRKKESQLETQGQIIDIRTGKIIIDFSSSIYSKNRGDLSDLAYQTGEAVANFILENSGEKQ
ncbi:MAG: hypothetical protein P9M12_05120 [Candidatus Aceula lacicola]|nr:hypothetical protein [Candidatus Aceula lacicola]